MPSRRWPRIWSKTAIRPTDLSEEAEDLARKGSAALEGIRGKNKNRPVIKIYRLDPERLRRYAFEKLYPLLRAR